MSSAGRARTEHVPLPALYNPGLQTPRIPAEPLAFIRACIAAGRVRWTYHVTMRLQERRLNSEVLRNAVATFEVIEAYVGDKYLPSYLVRGEVSEFVFPALVATDLAGDKCSCGDNVLARSRAMG